MRELKANTIYNVGEMVSFKGNVLAVSDSISCHGCFMLDKQECFDVICVECESDDLLFDIKFILHRKNTSTITPVVAQNKNATHQILDRIGRPIFSGQLNECLRSDKYKVNKTIKKITK